MYYYIYNIRNKVNNKIYIGVHKTKNLNDNYMGSGKIIKEAIKKYGIENFEKQIIQFFNSQEEMFEKEKIIVNEEFLSRDNVYNLRRGGSGGFDYINTSGVIKFKGKLHSEESKKKMGHLGNKHALGNQGGKKNKGKKRDKISCPYCLKDCAVNMFPRYHGNNCKMRV